MPRRMSFAKTKEQIQARTKTETRRLGWDFLKSGDILQAVNKTMGFKKGEKAIWYSDIIVVSTWREPLNHINAEGCIAEGFPEMSPKEFIQFFCEINKCEPNINVRVIQFCYR